MAKRTMKDYMDLMNHLKENEDRLPEVFGLETIEEVLAKFTLDKIYSKLENREIKRLAMGQFVGIDVDEELASSSDVHFDRYSELDYDDIVEIQYGHILEHLPKEKAYRVLAVGGYKGAEDIVVMKLKYKNIKVLFNDEYDEYKYELIKKLSAFNNGTAEEEG